MTFKPMLAGKYADTVPFPRLASVKLDGIRCLCLDGDIKSRKLLPLPNDYIRGILGDQALHGLDGELIVGEAFSHDVYNVTNSVVMSDNKAGDFHFWVFDLCDVEWMTVPYVERLREAIRRVQDLPDEIRRFIKVTEQVEVSNTEALLAYEDRVLEIGFEGVMLRDPVGRYKHGRSTAKGGELLKLKRFEDAEAKVIGFEEEFQNTNEATRDELGRTKRSSAQAGMVGKGILGRLHCETPAGVQFWMAGFTAKQKTELWEIRDTLPGRLAKYKFFARGVIDKPRHPNFLGFRDAIDTGAPA